VIYSEHKKGENKLKFASLCTICAYWTDPHKYTEPPEFTLT